MVLENCSYLRDARAGKEARALKAHGFDVSVISPEFVRLPNRVVIDEVVVYGFPFPSFPSHTLGYLVEYTYAVIVIAVLSFFVCITRGFDIIHIANPPDCIVPVMAIYQLVGKCIIYDQHDLAPELYAVRFSRSSAVLLRAQHWLERISYLISDHVIVTNESYKAIATGRGSQPDSKITIVRNGPELRQSYMLKPIPGLHEASSFVIVYAGVIGYQDGLDYLCHALAFLRDDHKRSDFSCILVGDGDALSDVKRLTSDLKLEERMRFCGWVSEADTYFGYLASADICVAPEPSNQYNDKSTFVKVIDYMFAGKPIVAFDLPETRFTAQDSATYVSANDCRQFAAALARLMDDDGLRRRMGSAGRARVQSELAWDHARPALLSVYDRLLDLGNL